MRILITGANGQLGNELRILARESHHEFVFSDISNQEGVETTLLDITDIDAVRSLAADRGIDCIVNCAAYTNVNKAETDAVLCRRINAHAPENLAKVMKERDGLLVHVSTDYVFGADPCWLPCREDQPEAPCGVYGLTKLEGEQSIRRIGCDSIIMRTAWLYSEFGNNFVKTMLSLTASKPTLNVVFDQAGTPTYALDLARAIITVIGHADDRSKLGTYHFSNEGVCSWYDFAKAIAEISGHTQCDIRPCHSDEFPSPVARPAYSVLDKTKIKQTFGLRIPYWTDSLRLCINNIEKQNS